MLDVLSSVNPYDSFHKSSNTAQPLNDQWQFEDGKNPYSDAPSFGASTPAKGRSDSDFVGTADDALNMILVLLYVAQIRQRSVRIQGDKMADQAQKLDRLNSVVAALQAVDGLFPADAKPSDTVGKQDGYKDDNYKLERDVNQAFLDAGIKPGFDTKDGMQGDGTSKPGNLNVTVTKSTLEARLNELTSAARTLGNTQSRDMVDLNWKNDQATSALSGADNMQKKYSTTLDAFVNNLR